MTTRLPLTALLLLFAAGCLVSCGSSDEPKRRERKPPPVVDSTMPWNRPAKWEGSGRYGQMMPGSR